VSATGPELSIVVPAYNEEQRLGTSLASLLDWVRTSGRQVEIVVADDGSADATAAVAARTGDPRVRVLRLPANRGKGAALRAAVAESRGRLVLLTDADLSTPIAELARLEAEIDRAEVVIGSRAVGGANITERQPFWREWSGRIFNRVIQVLAIRGLRDTQCGFKLLRGDVARDLFARLTVERYAFDVELLWLAGRLGHRVKEVGVEWRNDPSSRVRLWRDGPRMVFDVVRFRWRHRAMARGEGASRAPR
jgi:dolichyl-phosphate beta-glucosyltransferase